jgi:hypothetical protein
MNTATATIDEETKNQHAEIDRKAKAAKDFQVQLGQLERQVEAATQRLVNAAAFKAHLSKRIVELRQLVLNLWGKTREVVNVDPHSQACDAYNTILISELAIKDWPRVEAVLRANLDKATRDRDEFSKRAPAQA